MLRALNIPAGDHLIHFEFAPDSVRKGDTISVICICLMYAAILFILVRAMMPILRRKND